MQEIFNYLATMTIREIFNVLAGVLLVAGLVPYIFSILRRETIPTKSTWLIWSIVDSITITGMWATEALNVHIVTSVAGVLVITILSFWYGESGWTRIDKICLAGAALGIALWVIFDSPVLGIAVSLTVTFIGSLPTFNSSWIDPTKEYPLSWQIGTASCICAIIAIPAWTLEDAAQPFTFFAIDAIMVFILAYRPYAIRNWS